MNFLPNSLSLLWLQSNDFIAKTLGNGGSLKPDITAYTGITGIFAQFFLYLIGFFAAGVHNYGLAIILTCIAVRALMLPLTRTQIRGMRMMQMLQPVQKEITRFYSNKLDQNAKLMELYSEYKINPLAGCLPMLLQLPIMFGVYRALYDPSFVGHKFLGIQLLFPVNLTSARSFGMGAEIPDLIDITVAQLGLQGQIWHAPANIPLIGGGFYYWPALILVLLYVASSFFMQRAMKKYNAPDKSFADEFKVEMKNRDDTPPPPDIGEQMQRNMGMMNIFLVLIAFIFSAGALIYFIVQNLLIVAEYAWFTRDHTPPFTAAEMKAFIRRPPPPQAGAAGVKPAPAAPAAKAPGLKAAPALQGASQSVKTTGDDPADSGDNDASPSGRPRKKRRKR